MKRRIFPVIKKLMICKQRFTRYHYIDSPYGLSSKILRKPIITMDSSTIKTEEVYYGQKNNYVYFIINVWDEMVASSDNK